MTPNPSPVWKGDWFARAYGALRRLGFETASDFLNAHPSETYHELAERLGSDIAPVQIQHLQFLEAKESGRVRAAAMDGLARKLREHIPEGWAKGSTAKSKAMDAYAHWAGMVETRGKNIEAGRLLAVWRALERIGPPEGWLPSDARDDILVRAFAEGWPPEHAE